MKELKDDISEDRKHEIYKEYISIGEKMKSDYMKIHEMNEPINNFLLKPGALTWINPLFSSVDLSFLGLICFIAVIASMVQLVELVLDNSNIIYNFFYLIIFIIK